MNKTDLSCISKKHVHTPVSLRKPLRCGFTILLCSCLLVGASHCRAQETQDAAEAARQERARKEQSKEPKHVYTEEDLGRARILTPEDEARFAAQRHLPSPPGSEPQLALDAATFNASAEVPQLPLGDIARRYRDAKLALQAPSPFHLPFDEPAFAAPIVPVSKPAPPRPSFSPTHPNLVPARPNSASAPSMGNPAPLRRVDPFARRPAPVPPSSVTHIAPTAPVAQPRVSRPAPAPELREPNVSHAIAAPKMESRNFSPLAAQPNSAPEPAAPVPQPRVWGPAPAPELGQPSLTQKIAAPKFESRKFSLMSAQPNSTPAPNRPVLQPQVSRPELPQSNVSSDVPAPKFGSRKFSFAVQPNSAPGPIAPPSVGAAPNVTPTMTARPAVVEPSSSSHTVMVQRGDSLWKLAQRNLGRGSRWPELLAANPRVADPTHLAPGTKLVVPVQTSTLATSKSDTKISVEKGDTLTKIAQSQYRRATAWRCIVQANPEIINPDRIYEGQQLLLPFNCRQ